MFWFLLSLLVYAAMLYVMCIAGDADWRRPAVA